MNDQLPNTVGLFVWRYLRHEKKYLMGMLLTALVWSLEMSFSPYLMKVIIDTVVAEVNHPDRLFHAIMMPMLLYASMSLILNISFRFYNYINLRLNPKIKSTIHQDVFAYILKHSYAFYQDHFVGSLTRKIADLVTNVEMLVSIPNEWFIPRALAALIASVTLFHTVHPVFGLILLSWGVLFVGCSYLASKRAGILSKQTSEAFSKLDGVSSDTLANVMSVKLFNNIKYQISHISKKLKNLVNCDRAFQWYNLKLAFFQGLSVTLLIISMLIALLYGLKLGYVSAGDFALVLMLTTSFSWSVYDLGSQIQQFSKIKGTCSQALNLLAIPHEIIDVPHAKALSVTEGAIAFHQVQFAYQNQQPIFKDLSIHINPGEKVGLVGYSGAGKSTFIKLILRLVDIQAGEICIDNQDIKKIKKSTLREQIGTIPQEPELFHQTILENIKFARPDASKTEVIEAAKKAKCHEFIMALPHQYEALVGERGVKLSGGQKQRIAIARAFLKNAPILLLDEATSSLDSVTEREIHTALHEVMENKTTLVIAHRLATLKDMDRILVFVGGSIQEDGTLKQLLNNKSSIFYTLWQMQSDGFINSVDILPG
jgi:ATP-binding cassette, subfamily B, bacterial